jgi:hypothetical protein
MYIPRPPQQPVPRRIEHTSSFLLTNKGIICTFYRDKEIHRVEFIDLNLITEVLLNPLTVKYASTTTQFSDPENTILPWWLAQLEGEKL